MKRKRGNTLSGPALLTLGLILVSAAMLWLANHARQSAINEHMRAAQEAREASSRYQRTANDEAVIRRTIERFDNLRKRGIIGPEKRLDWADHLRAIRDQHRLAQLDFELAPLRVAGPLSTPGDYVLNVSRMQIRAGLLHEGDFFDLIGALRQPADAIIAPRRCALAPSSERTTQNINLRAECTVDWLTIAATSEAKP